MLTLITTHPLQHNCFMLIVNNNIKKLLFPITIKQLLKNNLIYLIIVNVF